MPNIFSVIMLIPTISLKLAKAKILLVGDDKGGSQDHIVSQRSRLVGGSIGSVVGRYNSILALIK